MEKNLFKITVYCWALVALLGNWSCTKKYDEKGFEQATRHQLVGLNDKLTDGIVKDIFTPPVASRIYAYANLAAYEALAAHNPDYLSLAPQLNGQPELPQPYQEVSIPLTSALAFIKTGKKLIYNKPILDSVEKAHLAQAREFGLPASLIDHSVKEAEAIAASILAYAQTDGYVERQGLSRYVLKKEPGKWVPTPPDYNPGIEPNWSTLRPFVLDSAQQFAPPPPTDFDSLTGSPFYEECMEVYRAVKEADEERWEIAKFWDCNPNISYTKGHTMFFEQKISPGGHWIGITGIASQNKDLDIYREGELFASVSLALADAFISCWDEKYRSSLIRPETYISRYIDDQWSPILQTPAFPEYTSGHSVASAAAATVLTQLLGEQVAFVDSTEVKYGLPVRNFASFYEASDEAAISRLYGGIHYRPAIENGVEQGKKVGHFFMKNIRTRREALASSPPE